MGKAQPFDAYDPIERDAFSLRQTGMPDERANAIILQHVEVMKRKAMSDNGFAIEMGQVNPRVVRVAEYINSMFRRHNRQRDVILPAEAETLFTHHLQEDYAQELHAAGLNTVDRAINLTAVSCMWYAVSRIRGEQTQLVEFVCQPQELALAG